MKSDARLACQLINYAAMKHTFITKSCAALLLAMSGTTAFAAYDLPETTAEGLQRVPDTKMAIVYAAPGASLAGYTSVLLLDAHVAFKKDWLRQQRTKSVTSNRVSSRDMEDMKKRLATEFDTVFREKLTEAGYPVVDEPGDAVLLLRPAIINLDVTAPDTMSANRNYTITSSAGEMTLYLEMYDSVTGSIIIKALDRKGDRSQLGQFTLSSSVKNKAAANRILAQWADILVDALNEAKAETADNEEGAESGD